MRTETLPLKFKFSAVLTLGIFILAICSQSAQLVAQTVTATINGTITDPTGNVVANAEVKATDLDRGTAWPTKTTPRATTTSATSLSDVMRCA